MSKMEALDPRTYSRALSCVHCGLCLPACPTYLLTGLEAQGPRGRIQLMRGLSDGVISPTESVRGHLDSCLDCRACETACPSNVIYHELIEETRQRLHQLPVQKSRDRWLNLILFHVLPYPTRLKLLLLPVRILQRVGVWKVFERAGIFKLLPRSLRKMAGMLPAGGELWPMALPDKSIVKTASRQTSPRLSVGFFGGCVGSVMFQDVNRKAVQLLNVCGVDVFAPPAQGCCGALHHHGGETDAARKMARRNIDLFGSADLVVTAIAGCGAMLKEYDLLLRDDPAYRERAMEFSRRVRDINQLLAELPMPLPDHAIHRTVTYHDACHLVHGQKISREPRELLGRIPGLKIIPLAQSDMCCGAAGSYNLTQPEMAQQLADLKLEAIAATKAEIVVAANAGCALHLQGRASEMGREIRVVHPVELLHAAVFGEDFSAQQEHASQGTRLNG